MTTITAPGEATIQLITTGTWNGQQITTADLDQAVSNAVTLKDYVRPRLYVGHTQDEPTAMEPPSCGTLVPGSLRREGQTLLGDFVDIPPIVMRALAAKLYRGISLEADMDFAQTNAARDLSASVPGFTPPTGFTVTGAALAGASVAACRTLPDLAAYLARDASATVRPEVRLMAGEVRPRVAPKITNSERLDRVAREIARLDARNHGLRRMMAEEKADMTTKFTSFAPTQAATAEPLSHTFLAEVEARLQASGASRDDLAARRKAARDVLVTWRDRAPSPHGPADQPSLADQLDPRDVEKAITSYSPSGGSAANPSNRDQPGATPTVRYDSSYMRPRSNSVPVADVSRAAVPSYARSTDAAPAASTTRQAQFDGVTATTYGSWPTTMSEHEETPTYGSRTGAAAHGSQTWGQLKKVAAARGLDLSRPADLRQAQAIHFADTQVGLKHAGTYEQAFFAALRQIGVNPLLVCMSEPAKDEEAARIVMAERPDLCAVAYGSHETATETPRSVAFSEVVAAELERLDDVDPTAPDKMATATRRALARAPKIAPNDYGSVPRRV